jgi:KDO2-lipid IV(A) lauroyltransferase
MKKAHPFRHRLESAAAAVVSLFLRRLPRRAALGLGRRLGRLWARLDPRHVAIAMDNLRRAFPDWTEERARQTAHAVYEHFGTVMCELLWLPGRRGEEILSFVDAANLEYAEHAETSGRGYIYVCAHFGNWEMHGISHAFRSGRPISVIARHLDNPYLDARLSAVRQMSGNQVVYKEKALGQVMKRLRDGGGVAILIDQNVQEADGIFVDFFGRPAATTTVAAALAVKTGCLVLPAYAELQPDGRYLSSCDPPIEWTPSGDREKDIALLTQKMTAVIEGWIRRRPEQWLWMHRRWKTQPRAAEPATPEVEAREARRA